MIINPQHAEDEHFWGYYDLIEQNYDIIIIKEWECNKLIGN